MTSKYIAELLEKRGEKVFYADEAGGNQPADYEFHSYLTEEDLLLFSETEQEMIIVENPHRDWEDAYEQIKELIVKGNNK